MITAPCPSDDDLLRFADGAVAGGALADLEAHVDGCAPCRMALSAVAPARVITDEHLGRYRVDGVLGRGGMGLVLRGHDPELDRPVALKLVRTDGGDPALRARLRREARALARLNHPNVCQVYDVGDDGDETYLAMELVDGATLRAHLATGPTARALLEIVVAAGRGLAAAHAAGVIHRDVKPDNLLIATDGRVVVSDFGLAGAAPVAALDGDAAPVTTRAIGTLGYAAPEQLLGRPIDPRADQFGLCATAWEALTGRRPFEADTVGAQILAIGGGPVGPAPASRTVAAVLRRGMAADPAARFPSMTALVTALRPRGGRSAALAIGAATAAALAAVLVVRPWRSSAPAAEAVEAGIVELRPVELRPGEAEPGGPGPVDAGSGEPRAAAAATRVGATPSDRLDAGTAARPPAVRPVAGGAGAVTSRPAPASLVIATPPAPRRPAAALDAAVATWCRLPVDPRHPDPSLAAWHRADWGPVVRAERAALVDGFTGLPRAVDLVEVRGQAGVHRVMRTAEQLPGVGAFVIVCDNSPVPPDEVAQVPVAWRDALRVPSLLAPVAGPPRITAKAALAPVHLNAVDLDEAARAQQWSWRGAASVVARVLISGRLDGGRFTVGDAAHRWIVEVPAGTPGAAAIAPGQPVWIVLAEPRVDAGTLTLTARDAEPRYVTPP